MARPELSVVDPLEETPEPRDVERVGEALAEGLRHDRELGPTPDRFEERVGLEALQVRGRARAPVHSWDIEGAHRRVAEARREER